MNYKIGITCLEIVRWFLHIQWYLMLRGWAWWMNLSCHLVAQVALCMSWWDGLKYISSGKKVTSFKCNHWGSNFNCISGRPLNFFFIFCLSFSCETKKATTNDSPSGTYNAPSPKTASPFIQLHMVSFSKWVPLQGAAYKEESSFILERNHFKSSLETFILNWLGMHILGF